MEMKLSLIVEEILMGASNIASANEPESNCTRNNHNNVFSKFPFNTKGTEIKLKEPISYDKNYETF